MKLKTFKNNIKTNLANNFIKSSKYLINVQIFHIKNFYERVELYVDYKDLNYWIF